MCSRTKERGFYTIKLPTPLINEEVPSETDDNGVERDANDGIDEAGQSTKLSL